MKTLVELCAGTASVSLWALARVRPLTGYMGSKRADAARLCTLLGARDPDRVVLVDAGPWGDVWSTLQHARHRAAVAARLRQWDAAGTLPEVWPYLVQGAPPADPADRAAQYLCLQARAAGCIPAWWSKPAGRWESPSGSRKHTPDVAWPQGLGLEAAHQRGGTCDLKTRMKQQKRLGDPAMKPVGRKIGKLYRSHPARGLIRIATLAERVEALGRIDWHRVQVVHGRVEDVRPIPGSLVYFDPPYRGAPRYAELLPRESVLEVAQAHAAVAERVIVSEAEPLPLEGWRSERLRPRGKPEWITMSAPPARRAPLQLGLGLPSEGAAG